MPNPVAKIRLLCLDVDGVMTDGGVRIDDHGVETKKFHVRDGAGIRIWLRLGCEVAVITGRSGMAVHHRASELGIRYVLQGVKDKREAFNGLLCDLDLTADRAAMLADDLPDLPVMRLAGYPMAVADAAEEVLAAAAFVTARPGGAGAVREAVEHLVKARGEWDRALRFFD